MELSIGNITQRIPTERAAYEFLEELRWAGATPSAHTVAQLPGTT
jgi:hypothetical protein